MVDESVSRTGVFQFLKEILINVGKCDALHFLGGREISL